MISIEQIEYFLPKNVYQISKRYKSINKSFLKKKIGANSLPRLESKETVIDLAMAAANKLNIDKIKSKIKSVILCTQNPEFGGLPHNSAIIHEKLGINTKSACFDLSQGCAGYLYGVVASESFLSDGEYGLFLTCDPYSKVIKKNDYKTDILFGDASSVTLLKKNGNGKKLYDYEFFSFGSEYDAIINKKGLEMDGKKVMNFCTTIVPKKIKQFLEKNNLNISSIDQFYFHQGSKFIVDQITQHLNIPKKSKPPFISNIGNTVSSTIPILMKANNFKKKKKILICGFGVGLSISIGILI